MGQGTTYLESPFSCVEETQLADYGSSLPVGRGQISPDAPPGNIESSEGYFPEPVAVPGLVNPGLVKQD